jgi:hypothetical protein
MPHNNLNPKGPQGKVVQSSSSTYQLIFSYTSVYFAPDSYR